MQFEQKIEDLKRKIHQHKKACLSPWPTPSDYQKLIDAQYALREIQDLIEGLSNTETTLSHSHAMTRTPPPVKRKACRTRFIRSY